MLGFVNRSHAGREMFYDIDSRLRPEDVVIPGLDAIGHFYTAYSGQAAQGVTVFRALDTMIDKMKSGYLKDYFERRGLKLPGNHNVILLASPDEFKGVRAAEVKQLLNSAELGLARPVRINHIRKRTRLMRQ